VLKAAIDVFVLKAAIFLLSIWVPSDPCFTGKNGRRDPDERRDSL
jgi:hypothetical protein